MNIAKKIVFGFLAFVVLFSSHSTHLAPDTSAASGDENLWNHEWYSEQDPFAWYTKVYDTENSPPSEIFGERYTAAQVQWIFYALWANVWNMIPGNPELTICAANKDIVACKDVFLNALDTINPLTSSKDNSAVAAQNRGFLETIGSNQVSGIAYTKDLISKFSPVSTVKAQGLGFTTGANSVKKLWQATRNISYALVVMAIIVMAFMIMFRVKINPQTVVSVQSALPNVILTVVLITFSYAIAGFMIDLMYVVIGLISSLLVSNNLSSHTFTELFNELTTNHSAFYLMYAYWIAFMWNALLAIFVNLGSGLLGILVFLFAIMSIFAILWWSIKIIYVILKNFAMVVLTIALGPLEILTGAFTGRSSFGNWLKKLVSYLAVYPLLALIFFFAFFFLVQGSDSPMSGIGAGTIFGNPVHDAIGDNSWKPPFSGFRLGDNILWIVVSFVIFSQATKAIEIVQGIITGKPFAYGSAVGEAVGPLRSVWGATGAPIAESYQQAVGRERVAAFQDNIRASVRGNQRIPEWLKNVLLADPGHE